MRSFFDPLWLGPWFVGRRFTEVRGVDRSAALAYVTLVSLVPMLATLAVLYRSFFSGSTDRIVELITLVLPYSTDAVQRTLADFVSRAAAIGGVGSVVFLAIAYRLYLSIETTLNEVWCVATRRSPAVRMFSFTMVVFWGPVVMGVGSTLLFWLGHQSWAPSSALLLSLGRVTLPLLGLTMVYWLAPHTGVHIGSALIGGATAVFGLQLLRTGFVAYIRRFPNINVIYGSLTLAILFLVSLFAFWTLVIIGAVTSYVVQNWSALILDYRGTHPISTEPSLTALAVLTECFRRQAENAPAATIEDLESELGISNTAARNATERLILAGLLAVTGGGRDGFVPGRDASHLTVGAALSELDDDSATPPGQGKAITRLGERIRRADEKRQQALREIVFAELIEPEEQG